MVYAWLPKETIPIQHCRFAFVPKLLTDQFVHDAVLSWKFNPNKFQN